MNVSITVDVGPELISMGDRIMAVLSDFTTKLDAILATVATIKQEIVDLKAQIATGGMPAADEQQLLDKLTILEAAMTDAANV